MTNQDTSGTVAKRASLFDDDALAALSWDTLAQQLAESGAKVENFDDYGTGFSVIDKDKLLGVGFVIVEWRFNEGDMGEFVSAVLVTQTGEKVVINDGSTGIYKQLLQVTTKREENGIADPYSRAGLAVPKGLRVSRYDVEIDGKTRPAETFYLAN